MTTAVNLVILLLMDHFSIFSTLLIHCGMYIVVLKVLAVQPLVFHGSIRSLTLPLLTIYLELRVCGDQDSNEDSPVSFYASK